MKTCSTSPRRDALKVFLMPSDRDCEGRAAMAAGSRLTVGRKAPPSLRYAVISGGGIRRRASQAIRHLNDRPYGRIS